CERIRLVALVAVDCRRGEQAGGARMLQYARNETLAGRGDDVIGVDWRERVVAGAVLAQRLVQVPPARKHVREPRSAHERGVIAVPAANLFHGTAKQRHVVRGSEAVRGIEGDLELARTELTFERAHRQTERL